MLSGDALLLAGIVAVLGIALWLVRHPTRFLNERLVWGAASSNGNGKDGRKADVTGSGRQQNGSFWDRDLKKLPLLGLDSGGCREGQPHTSA
jgi:hypothetical protein